MTEFCLLLTVHSWVHHEDRAHIHSIVFTASFEVNEDNSKRWNYQQSMRLMDIVSFLRYPAEPSTYTCLLFRQWLFRQWLSFIHWSMPLEDLECSRTIYILEAFDFVDPGITFHCKKLQDRYLRKRIVLHAWKFGTEIMIYHSSLVGVPRLSSSKNQIAVVMENGCCQGFFCCCYVLIIHTRLSGRLRLQSPDHGVR